MPHKTALQRAHDFQIEASEKGFEWDDTESIFEKLSEEIAELRLGIRNNDPHNIEEEIGDILFVIANIAKNLGFEAETALTKANDKFERRYQGMFELFQEHYPDLDSHELSFDQWDALWAMQKAREKARK